MRLFVLALIAAVFLGCARGPIKNNTEALRRSTKSLELADDLELNGLAEALQQNIKEIRNSTRFRQPMRFGTWLVDRDKYAKALEFLLEQLKLDPTGEKFRQSLKQHFEVYEVYGEKNWGEAFITAYYEPVIGGSRRPSKRFSQALYKTPDDMVNVDMGAFFERFPNLSEVKAPLFKQARGGLLRGRVMQTPEKLKRVVPYFTREEIDSGGVLKAKGLEWVWVDPLEAFFLQIQGSGSVKIGNTELRLGYHSQNGHGYTPIGRFLLDHIPIEEMSLQSIEKYLRTLPQEEQQSILNKNESYVFFQKLKSRPLTYFGTEVVAGRTIATDTRYFPKGALALLKFQQPQFLFGGQEQPLGYLPRARFVLDQDTGGAIRGPHRVDLFWGRGPLARQAAGVMKHWGELYYFVPKKAWLAALTQP